VRVAIRPAGALAPGEHRAMVYFDEVLHRAPRNSVGVRGRFRIGAAIYAYQGEPQRLGHISGLQVDAKGLTAQLASGGTAHARLQGFYAIWRADAFPGLTASPFAPLPEAPPKENGPPGSPRRRPGAVAGTARRPAPTAGCLRQAPTRVATCSSSAAA
jgi:hypothetical protein